MISSKNCTQIVLLIILYIMGLIGGLMINNTTKSENNLALFSWNKKEMHPIIESENDDYYNNNAIQAYKEFLNGYRNAGIYSINSIIIPTGEPERRYRTKYAYFDANGDGIMELHVKTPREYLIFTYLEKDVVIWKSLSPYYEPLDNRAYMYSRYLFASVTEAHSYLLLDYFGKEILEINFAKIDSDLNDEYDNDIYFYGEIEVSKEIYDAITQPLIIIKSDLINWEILCDSI